MRNNEDILALSRIDSHEDDGGAVVVVKRRRPRQVTKTARRTKRLGSTPNGQQPGWHPRQQRLAWYAGLILMAGLEIIDWPIAITIGVGHEIAHRARWEAVRELAAGIEAGA